MAETKANLSVAIETTCRAGGLAMGVGEALSRTDAFDASARHATQLIRRLDALLAGAGLGPADVDELYVSAGPGSFTGTRIGVTVARTLAQVRPGLRLVAVPTVLAIAENARDLAWDHLAVILDAREQCIHASLLGRDGDRIVPAGEPVVCGPDEFLAAAPRPLLLIGEGLGYYDLSGEGVALADAERHLPTPEGVWRVGRRMARDGEWVARARLRPIYARRPKALRDWQARQNGD